MKDLEKNFFFLENSYRDVGTKRLNLIKVPTNLFHG